MKPAQGRFTSGFAGRDIGAGAEYHYGIDIANSEGTPIVAAADGVVFRASPLSTYGNVVMITHNINGQTYTSLYAHMSRFGTSVGKTVKKVKSLVTLVQQDVQQDLMFTLKFILVLG